MNMRTCSIALMLAATPLLATAEGQSSRFTDTDAFLLGIIDSTGHPKDVAGSTAAGPQMMHDGMGMQPNQEHPQKAHKHGLNDDWCDESGDRRTPHEYRLEKGL